MKIPSTIKIKRANWNIVFTNTMDFGPDMSVYGLCDPKTRTLFIKKGLTERQTLITLVHEILHALESDCDIDLGHRIINKIDFVIADLIRFIDASRDKIEP